MELLNNYHEGISNNDYHANKEFFSSSQLKNAIESYATFRYYMENGKKDEDVWSPTKINSKDFGTLVHTLLLEPENLMDEFLFIDVVGKNFRTKEGKEYKAKMLSLAESSNKIPMAAHGLEKARKCVESVRKHDFANKLMTCPGRPELSGYFKEENSDLLMRFRPDRLVDLDEGSAIVDVKTTQNIEEFNKIANWTFHYDLSAYMYIQGHKQLTGEEVPFFFLVVESETPYRTAVYKASKQFLDRGMKKFNIAVENVLYALDKPVNRDVFQQADWEII